MSLAIDSLSWSKTQVSNLNNCKKKYFFSNINSFPRTDMVSSRKATQIAQLKGLKNRYLWGGAVIHGAIGNLLKMVRQGTHLPDENDFVLEVQENMREEFKASKNDPLVSGKSRFFEHEYNMGLHPTAWQKNWGTVERSLRWFYSSSWLARFKKLEPHCWKCVDDVVDFDLDGIRSYVKLDCAVEVNGRIFIIDWKTSKSKASHDFSLVVGALYAVEVWGAAVCDIAPFMVFLLDGTQQELLLTEEMVRLARIRIHEESRLLAQARQQLNELHDISLIPETSYLETCMRCNFQRVCHPLGVGRRN